LADAYRLLTELGLPDWSGCNVFSMRYPVIVNNIARFLGNLRSARRATTTLVCVYRVCVCVCGVCVYACVCIAWVCMRASMRVTPIALAELFNALSPSLSTSPPLTSVCTCARAVAARRAMHAPRDQLVCPRAS
jgi:hypothetical protein